MVFRERDCLFLHFSLDYLDGLNVFSSKDALELMNGNVSVKDLDMVSIKTVLALVNFSWHPLKVKSGPFDSALQFFFTIASDRRPPVTVNKEMTTNISSNDDEDDNQCFSSRGIDKKLGRLETTLNSDIVVENDFDIVSFFRRRGRSSKYVDRF